MNAEWRGELKAEPGRVSYRGPGGPASPHSHFAVQAIRSLDQSFVLDLEGDELVARTALVPSGVRHGFRAEGGVEIVLIEADSALGTALQHLALEWLGRDLGELLPEPSRDDPGVIGALTRSGMLPSPEPAPPAGVVEGAIGYIEANLDGSPSLTGAAASVHISPSRLTHLFSEQIGIPFRRYVLWARIRRMVEMVSGGSNLTEAAVGSGFSDSSHLSRVFRENFGLPPSALLHMRLAGVWAGPSGAP